MEELMSRSNATARTANDLVVALSRQMLAGDARLLAKGGPRW